MPLESDFPSVALLQRFPKQRQTLGFELWQDDAVTVDDILERRGRVTILGNVEERHRGRRRVIRVVVEVGANDQLKVDCTCKGARYCEHGFALLLQLTQLASEESADDHPLGAPMPARNPGLRLAANRDLANDPGDVWRRRLQSATSAAQLSTDSLHPAPQAAATPAAVPLHYVLPIDVCRQTAGLHVVVLAPTQIDGRPMLSTFDAASRPQQLTPADRRALLLLERVSELPVSTMGKSVYELPPDWIDLGLSLMAAQGHLFCTASLGSARLERPPLTIDPGPPFRCATIGEFGDTRLLVRGELRRGDEKIEAEVLLGTHHAIAGDRIVRVEVGPAAALMRTLLHDGPLEAPRDEARELMRRVLEVTTRDPLVTPPAACQPAPPAEACLVVHLSKAMKQHVPCELQFDHGGRLLEFGDESLIEPSEPDGPWLQRDREQERALLDAFRKAHAARLESTGIDECFLLAKKTLYRDLTAIVASGQRVLADGKPLLPSRSVSISVSSGIDWFDLKGTITFDGGVDISLAQALLSASRGEQLVELGDGRTGVLPKELLERWAPLLALGVSHDDAVRIRPSQAMLLDALLSSRSDEVDVAVDRGFERYRERLRAFQGIQSRAEPTEFLGQLRDYQRDGLGWLWFLRDLGLGGCLADDMGLGKTVQVLALLAEVHRDHQRPPSLLVVPRSLLDNWRKEAARFAPALRVLDFSGTGRWQADPGDFRDHDLVLTTYGTLRSDISRFDELQSRFEYAILDEAQAIENAESATSKAVRLLRAEHRLALTGTPVQNHIGELWALFEFLCPGMLGKSQAFRRLAESGKGRETGPDLEVLRRAIAPFLLRRTKEQVLRELPEKQEQTLQCELGDHQRRTYDALRDHYRSELLHGSGALDSKERFRVLEAMLRLRQAACHEGLIDPKRVQLPSAKLDALLPMLDEIAASDHKALVFSQFTSLLAIVRQQLDARGIRYQYLDGRTRKRQEKVDRFQTDAACSVFLISLKAGGFGLNLTAADYVFLLDPWWNPAAEAQAVDRAHRIGQTRRVAAYRLVASDTVEDKVLQLQQQKRALADALLADNASLLAQLDREQLAELLA